MICAAAATGLLYPMLEWTTESVVPAGIIPNLMNGWTGMKRARLMLTPALYWDCRRVPLRISLNSPSPPTPIMLQERSKPTKYNSKLPYVIISYPLVKTYDDIIWIFNEACSVNSCLQNKRIKKSTFDQRGL